VMLTEKVPSFSGRNAIENIMFQMFRALVDLSHTSDSSQLS